MQHPRRAKIEHTGRGHAAANCPAARVAISNTQSSEKSKTRGSAPVNDDLAVNQAMSHAVIDCAAVGGLLLLGVLAAIFRRRIFRPVEKSMVRAAAWSLLSMPGDQGDSLASPETPPNKK